MSPRHFRHVLLALCLASMASLALAQDSSPGRASHVPIGQGITPEEADAFLRSRLQAVQANGDLEKLARELLANPERFPLSPELRERLANGGFSATDPELRKSLERFLNDPAGSGLAPEQIERAKRLLQSSPEGKASDQPGPPPPSLPSGGQNPPPIPNPRARSLEPPRPVPSLPPSSAPRNRPRADPKLYQNLSRLGEKLQGTRLGESQAVKQMVGDLQKLRPERGDSSAEWAQRVEAWSETIARLGERLPSNLKMPSIERLGARAPSGDLSPRSGVFPAFSSGDSDERIGSVLLLIVLAISIAAIALWLRHRSQKRHAAEESESLGPWPVRPEQVRSRQDLVRAFEYLALLRLGSSARAQHHHEVARGLAEETSLPASSDAASDLAILYERARYTPADESLDEDDLATARRRLCQFAGASNV